MIWFPFGLLVAALIWTSGCAGCSQTSSAPAAVGGTGGAPVAFGPPIADAGKTGFGGAGESGGDGAAGPQPALQWADTSNTQGPCPFRRLANAGMSKAFDWVPYPGVPGAEITRWTNAGFQDDGQVEIELGQAEESDAGARIAISVDSPSWHKSYAYVLLMDGEGTIMDGYWMDRSATSCFWDALALWHGTLAIAADPEGSDPAAAHTCLVASSSGAFSTFVVPKSVGGAQASALGASQWVWWWVPGTPPMRSFAVADGKRSDVALPMNVVNIAYPSSAGAAFFFDATSSNSDGSVTDFVGISDGTSALAAFLGGTPDGYAYGTARDAGQFLTWRRAKGWLGVNTYESVELWASPSTVNPTSLQPFLVGPLDSVNVSQYAAGGHGYVGSKLERSGDNGVRIWDIASRTSIRYDVPESDHVNNLMGMTASHLMTRVAKDKSNRPIALMRFSQSR